MNIPVTGLKVASPGNDEATVVYEVTKEMLDTDWYATQLNQEHAGAADGCNWKAITNAGSINAITAQSAGTAGSFTIDAMTDEKLFYAIASTDEL